MTEKTVQQLFDLSGKTAIVTGALGLLGKYHCKALAEAGANVAAADLNGAEAESFASDLGKNHIGISLDVVNRDSIKKANEFILNKLGSIDILVNNAAINDKFENPEAQLEESMFENYSAEMLSRSINVNITGIFNCAQIFGAYMAEKGKGSIINIASTYGVTAPDQSIYKNDEGKQVFYKSPAYPITKGAVLSFTRYLASYWGMKGVRVNSLSPGGVEDRQDDFFIKNYSAKTMLGRMAKPYDYKGALVFLASDAAAYMSGANLIVDGGWTAW